MGKVKVVYYTDNSGRSPVREYILSLPDKQLDKVHRAINPIVEFGIGSHLRNVRKLTGTSLWEIRILGRDNIRVLYAQVVADTVTILHVFIKKSQKTPRREFSLALQRLEEVKSRLTE